MGGRREVGYWLGWDFWDKGISTADILSYRTFSRINVFGLKRLAK